MSRGRTQRREGDVRGRDLDENFRLREAPERVTGLKSWFDARSDAYFTFSTGSQISAWVSRAGSMGAITFSQGTSANQPLRNVATSTFNGKNTVLFDGTNDQLVSNTTNDWKFLHDGTGSSIFVVRRNDSTGAATQAVLSNLQALSEVGILVQNGAAPAQNVTLGNGSGTALNAFTPSGAGARDTSVWDCYSHVTGLSTYARSGSVSTKADTGGQLPSSSNPVRQLLLSGLATPTNQPMKGHVAQLLFYDHVLTVAERTILANWAASEFGVAA